MEPLRNQMPASVFGTVLTIVLIPMLARALSLKRRAGLDPGDSGHPADIGLALRPMEAFLGLPNTSEAWRRF